MPPAGDADLLARRRGAAHDLLQRRHRLDLDDAADGRLVELRVDVVDDRVGSDRGLTTGLTPV